MRITLASGSRRRREDQRMARPPPSTETNEAWGRQWRQCLMTRIPGADSAVRPATSSPGPRRAGENGFFCGAVVGLSLPGAVVGPSASRRVEVAASADRGSFGDARRARCSGVGGGGREFDDSPDDSELCRRGSDRCCCGWGCFSEELDEGGEAGSSAGADDRRRRLAVSSGAGRPGLDACVGTLTTLCDDDAAVSSSSSSSSSWSPFLARC
mmetsp:Transcript_26893/g.82526  ORF Transcript_26893/g.82526 Transcript_26893/m.82526 type:complete len:212 (-) Transcript_26893:1110-1745(-)